MQSQLALDKNICQQKSYISLSRDVIQKSINKVTVFYLTCEPVSQAQFITKGELLHPTIENMTQENLNIRNKNAQFINAS